MSKVETSTPADTMKPIGPYSHIAKAGEFITIGGTAGVDPATGELVGSDIASQTIQILDAFEIMLSSVESDLDHVLHINIFLTDMRDFAAMNDAYAERMGNHRPARTAATRTHAVGEIGARRSAMLLESVQLIDEKHPQGCLVLHRQGAALFGLGILEQSQGRLRNIDAAGVAVSF